MAQQNSLMAIPGLAGYLQGRQMNEQQSAAGLQQLLGVANLIEQQKARQLQAQMQQAQLEEYKQRQTERERITGIREKLKTDIGGLYPGQEVPAGTGVTGGMDEGALGQILGPRDVKQDPRATLLKGMVDLDPSGLSDAFKAMIVGQRGGVGVDPMIVRLHKAADEAEAAGKPEIARQLRENAVRLARGSSDVDLAKLQGTDYGSQLRYAVESDKGVPVPRPGTGFIPGATQAQPTTPTPRLYAAP